MHIAERSLYIQIARIAWACNISKKRDANGKEFNVPLYDYCDGFNVQPNFFHFDLQVRSEQRWKVVEEAYQREMENDPLKNRWDER